MFLNIYDYYFEDNVIEHVSKFNGGCSIFLKEVDIEAARRFGIAVIDNDKVTYVEEKPENPKSNLAMTGLYLFDKNIFTVIKELKPSNRGELEITDAIDYYVKNGDCSYGMVKGYWSDAGTFESLFRASWLVKNGRDN